MKVFISVLSINSDHLESSQHTSSIIQTALKDFTLERIPIINESVLYTKSQVHIGHHCVKSVPHSELFWSTFSRIRTEYGEIWSISPYSVRMWQNADQDNSEYGHFSRSGGYPVE